jgi:glycosyltransferase involved in cell wall biosynthesis
VSKLSSRLRPRVLYIAFYFPPARASGVHRSRATANYLSRRDWDVTVLSAPVEFIAEYIDSYDASLNEGVANEIVVRRPKMNFYRWETDLRRYSRFRGTFPLLALRLHRAFEESIFPEAYASWIWPVLAEAIRLHRRESFDIILATGNPFASFAAAWLLHAVLRTPYAVDYRDSWTFDVYTGDQRFPPKHPARRWEARILRDAAGIFHVNQSILARYSQEYPGVVDKMQVIMNGWEPEVLGDLPQVSSPQLDRPLRFGYLGTLTARMPIGQLFAAWKLARHHDSLRDATLHIYGHLGFFPDQRSALLSRLPLQDGSAVYYEGPVPKASVGAAYDSIDVLLLWLAGGRHVTSGKVFEYMATGKPIVSVHEPGIAATEVLRGYPAWIATASLAPEDLRDSLVTGARMARELSSETALEGRRHAMAYRRDAVLAPLEDRLTALTTARRRSHT